MSDDWQPIETAPLDGTPLDLWDKDGYRVCNAQFKHHRFSNGEPVGEKSWPPGDRNWRGVIPTHWRHVPKPPKSVNHDH